MTTQDLIDYYKALLILQYASLGNALGTMDAFINLLVQNQIISQFRDAFNVETAIGAQLDMLATYRGLSRVVFGLVIGQYWSLVPYADGNPNSYLGWGVYTDVNPPSWQWLLYNDIVGVAYKLTDHQLRRMIQLKAALDSSPLDLGDLDNILYDFFGIYVNVIDNENMTMVYQHQIIDPDPDALFISSVLANVFPHPSGVAMSVVEV